MSLPGELAALQLLALSLGLALLAALAWAVTLRRTLQHLTSAHSPPVELFSPLFQAVVAEFDAGVLVIDHELQVRFLNAQAETLLRIKREQALGKGLIATLRDYQAEALVNDVQRDGETREIELQSVIGGQRLRLHAARFVIDQTRGTIMLLHDVTQLSNLERARRDLVANVSHELRNPLASVKLLVETVQSGPPPEVAQRMLSQMAQEVDAITQLVDELHELSQIESGRVLLQLKPMAIEPVVARALERIQPQAERKGLQIESQITEGLPLALIDVDRIGQVLLNLLHNSVKFTPERGTITVALARMGVEPGAQRVGLIEGPLAAAILSPRKAQARSASPGPQRASLAVPQTLQPGDWLLVSISDTGIGIPPPDLPRIFERFYKVDRARTRNAGGTGLGLAIAKHLIEGHGGRIWAVSREGVGSTFYVALPVA